MTLDIETIAVLSEIETLGELEIYMQEVVEDEEVLEELENIYSIKELKSFLREVKEEYTNKNICWECGGDIYYKQTDVDCIEDGVCQDCGKKFVL